MKTYFRLILRTIILSRERKFITPGMWVHKDKRKIVGVRGRGSRWKTPEELEKSSIGFHSRSRKVHLSSTKY